MVRDGQHDLATVLVDTDEVNHLGILYCHD
jgi:hypothetical protein